MEALVECVPNFSEGRKQDVIDAIAKAIENVEGCYLLDVDPGASTNRTVYTFVGNPDSVIQGALAAARVGHKLIDMTQHHGEHPRMGAMDVCPFIPVKNITIEQCVEISKKFAKLLSDELDVPVYLYSESQPLEYRKELPNIRQGEYEGLPEKLKDPKMKPDFGPCEFRPTYGASVVGAREFLLAYNVNILGTKEQAHRIALNIREQGRSEKEPGRLKKVRAIGWYLEEQNLAQVSINLIDFKTTNIECAFEECEKDAQELKLAVCGSEIVGLVPREAMLKAANHFIKKEDLLILEEDQKIKLVIQRLGLNSISMFDPKKKIIEYLVQEKLPKSENKYRSMPVNEFVNAVAARTSIPGGGCVAALCGSLGSALACMVSQLSYGNRKFEKNDTKMRQILPPLYDAYHEIVNLVDEDGKAFDSYIDARKMPDKTAEEKARKEKSTQDALLKCIQVPASVAYNASKLWPVLSELVPLFNVETRSDLLVAVKCMETAIFGGYENVYINIKGFNGNNEKVNQITRDMDKIMEESKINAERLIKAIKERK